MIEAARTAQALRRRQPRCAGVSFAAQDGRITGLLGPNGAGKSTTLRMLYATLAADARRGARRRRDWSSADNIAARAAHRRAAAQRRALPVADARARTSSISARLARPHARGRARAHRRADRAARHAGHRHAPRQGLLAGPEASSTALARALVHAPRNLILDEPTNGLDVPAVRKLRSLLVKLRDAGPLHPVLEPRDAGSGAALRRGRGDRARPRGGRGHARGAARAHRRRQLRGCLRRAHRREASA